MPYKNREVQPELFSGIKNKHLTNTFKQGLFSKNYKAGISIAYDALIVFIIAILMANLSFFVFGIERGKYLAKLNSEKEAAKATPATRQIQDRATIPASSIKIETPKIEQKKQVQEEHEKTDTGYVIQLVTYSSNGHADKEVARLKEDGVSGFVQKIGNYYVVYSDIYNDKTTAQQKLKDFQKRYKDCLVRFFGKS